MINIIDKINCCGCSACASACPKRCITMKSDNEGFLYPHLDKDTCIDCGLCEKVCNELHPLPQRSPLLVLAAINKDEEIRLKSSSGGIFHILAKMTIDDGGVVFGARFDENWQVVIDYAETMIGVEDFMGSKYVQARIENAYKNAKCFLIEGRKVLFSGTPCQVAGLKQFLRKEYDNLLTVDFICHGTPSPRVWGMYLDEVTDSCKFVKSISFRNKINSWKHLHFSVEYDPVTNATSLLSSAYQNQYMKAFLADLTLRPSCSSCSAKSGSSNSDITIADFWGIWNVNLDMYDDKGTSMLFINTDKGRQVLPSKELVKYSESDYAVALKYNKACAVSVVPNPKRKQFFVQLHATKSVIKLIDKTLAPPFLDTCVRSIKSFVGKMLKKSKWWGDHYYINPEISSITFRNKETGWKSYSIKIKIKDKKQ